MSDTATAPSLLDLKKLARYQQVLNDLVLIYAIVHCNGIGNASRALGYESSGAVSNRVTRLQKLLGGIALLEHHHSGTSKVTAEGERLRRMADIIIPELQAFVEAHENLSSDLRIATITSVWNHNREFIKKTFEGKCLSARIPDGAVRFIDHTETIVDVVRSGAVDVGIITYPPKSKQLGKSLAVQNWKTEEMVVVMSAKSSEITGQNWAKLGLFETYAAVLLEKQYGIRREIDRYFNRRGKSINVVAELGTISEIKELIAGSGDLITILPLPTVEGDGRLRWSSLSDNIPPRPVSFVYRLGSREIVQQFLKCFSEER